MGTRLTGLTQLDFFLQADIKANVYETTIKDLADWRLE